MVSPISNNISIGISPILSNQNTASDHLSSNARNLSKTSLDYTRDTTSVNMASQSATALGSQRKDGIQYTNSRTEKAFEENDNNDPKSNKRSNKKPSNQQEENKTIDITA